MTTLTIFSENRSGNGQHFRDFGEIAAQLNTIGVQFERWTADRDLGAEADQQTILEAYQNSIDKLMRQYGFRSVDVISLTENHPDKAALRQKFLAEHTHDDFEVRFFVEGRGLFYLHVANKVYAVLCEQGDLISVPANTRHWFDMGESPYLKCIRLFTTPDGWQAKFTGSDIAKDFLSFDQYLTQLP
jgi:1,2-dihydroxy-3-keto-5-methylthiopentene dioxygenase